MVIIWVSSNVYYIHLAFGVSIIVFANWGLPAGKTYISIPGICLPSGGQIQHVTWDISKIIKNLEGRPSPQALCMRQAPSQIGLDDRNSGSVDSLLRLRTNPGCRASWKSVSVQKVSIQKPMISLMVLPGGRDYDHMVMQQYLQQCWETWCHKPSNSATIILQLVWHHTKDGVEPYAATKGLVTVTASFIDIIYLNMPC